MNVLVKDENKSLKQGNFIDKCLKIASNVKGYLYILFGYLLTTISSFLFKHFTNEKGIEPVTLICFRGSFFCIFSGIYILLYFDNLKKFSTRHVGSLVIRSSINGLGMLLIVYALKYIRVSTLELILRTGNSSLSLIIGYFLLGEKVTIFDVYGLLSSLVGVVLILKPDFIFGTTHAGDDQFLGIVYAFICAFFGSWALVITKKLFTQACINSWITIIVKRIRIWILVTRNG
jgi:drug/metabolite transporter (DMT)-like permease